MPLEAYQGGKKSLEQAVVRPAKSEGRKFCMNKTRIEEINGRLKTVFLKRGGIYD